MLPPRCLGICQISGLASCTFHSFLFSFVPWQDAILSEGIKNMEATVAVHIWLVGES